jgi:CheY-like chemotaxis protein
MSRATRPRILIVDDEPAVRMVLSRYLRSRGCDVETAAHGREGLHRIAQTDFDAVVSDAQMPQMDGVTFLRLALEREPSLRRRVLLCSGSWPGPEADDPAIQFLAKPFDGEQLWQALVRLLAAPPALSSDSGS